MTTITNERALLEQVLNALLLPCDRWNGVQSRIVKEASDAVLSALAAPATAPEPFAYTTGLYGGRFTLEPVNPAVVIPKGFGLYLHPPKEKQPAWQDAPTKPGMARTVRSAFIGPSSLIEGYSTKGRARTMTKVTIEVTIVAMAPHAMSIGTIELGKSLRTARFVRSQVA